MGFQEGGRPYFLEKHGFQAAKPPKNISIWGYTKSSKNGPPLTTLWRQCHLVCQIRKISLIITEIVVIISRKLLFGRHCHIFSKCEPQYQKRGFYRKYSAQHSLRMYAQRAQKQYIPSVCIIVLYLAARCRHFP